MRTSTPGLSTASNELIKSPADPRSYRHITLANGLQVICIHEAGAEQAAAAMAVNAGHFDDPNDAQGLAHFLEHMLFLGTKAYPQAEDYQQFISAHGGHHNAWTGTEYSSFYFSIQAQSLAPALDRFARFFYEPLLAPEWVEKERQAVESEYRLKLNDELRRLYQVHKETANPAHPFTKFSVGNLETLANRSDATLAEQLHTFFQTHYQSRRMRLVVAGPQSLDELTSLAATHFSAIPELAESEKPQVTAPLYLPEQLALSIQVRPVKAARRLILSFPLPSIDADYQHKTASYIAHIIGYEGPDSLFSALRQRDWVNNLSAGGGMSGSNFKDFNINLQLTAQGLEHIDEIVRWVFAYIRLIEDQGIEDWRYLERKQLVDLSFHFQDPVRMLDLVSQLAVNAHHYAVEDIIYGDYRMDSLNQQLAKEFLAAMQPERLRMTIIHRDVVTDKITQLYQTPYRVSKLTRHQQHGYNQVPEDFHAELPAANRFIPKKLDPQPLEQPAAAAIPKQCLSTENLTIWHLQDPDFRQPKGHVYCAFALPAVARTARSFAAARLWCELVLDELNERCYDAEIAGLNFNLYPQQRGITLHIAGFSPGQMRLFEQICTTMASIIISPKRWIALQHKLVSNWQSAHTHKPMNKLFAELNYYLQPGSYRMEELAEELLMLNFSDFEELTREFFTAMNCDVLLHSDRPAADHKDIAKTLYQHFPLADQPKLDPAIPPRLLQRPASESYNATTMHSDTAVLWFVQGESTELRAQAGFMLLNQFISPEIFNQLRTEQQLGYLVGSNYLPMQQVPGILMYVQSPSNSASQLKQRLQEFAKSFLQTLPGILAGEWESTQRGLLRQLLDNDPNLRVRSQRLWSSITQFDHQFDRLEGLAREVMHWQPEQLLNFAKEQLGSQNAEIWLAAEVNTSS